jgi:outer membrane protein TolC
MMWWLLSFVLAAPLTEVEVLAAVDARVPTIAQAEAMIRASEAEYIGARGGADPMWQVGAQQWQGYYPSTRANAELSVDTVFGPTFTAGYRLGLGDFADYDGKAVTLDQGEFGASIKIPIRDLGLTKLRASMVVAEFGVERASFLADDIRRKARVNACKAYWEWVAAGRILTLEQDLLQRAETRDGGLRREVEIGGRPRIDLLDNARVLAKRRARVAKARGALVAAAEALALWNRDDDGNPTVPTADDLPEAVQPQVMTASLEEGLQTALHVRPSLRAGLVKVGMADIKRRRAERLRIPKISLYGAAYQDLGEGTDGRRPWDLRLGAQREGTLLGRDARGERLDAVAAMDAAEADLRGKRDAVVAEVRSAHAAWVATAQAWQASAEAYAIAEELLVLERRRQELGGSDLFRLVQREESVLDAGLEVADAEAKTFKARAVWQGAIASGEE